MSGCPAGPRPTGRRHGAGRPARPRRPPAAPPGLLATGRATSRPRAAAHRRGGRRLPSTAATLASAPRSPRLGLLNLRATPTVGTPSPATSACATAVALAAAHARRAAAAALGVPARRRRRRRRPRGRGRRPRARHGPRRLPPGPVPHAARRRPGRSAGGRPTPGGDPARRAPGQPVAAAQPAALRGPRRHGLRRGDRRLRRPRAAPTAGSRPRSGPYLRLHDLGWAHSVEAWSTDDGELAGGLYGVAIGGLFAGESMFHRRTDASKVALVGLVELLRDDGVADRLLDVQWLTPHLASLGAVEVARAD